MKNQIRYRLVTDFPGYRVGDDGSVWSCRKIGAVGGIGKVWRRLTPLVNTRRKGYLMVAPRRDGKNHPRTIHRLVLEAFVGPRPCGMECRHRNGDVRDNRLNNLKWSTPKRNADDKKRHGTYKCGVQCHSAKMDEQKVNKAREMYATGQYSYTTLARRFGITGGPMGQIIRGETWRHVNDA